MAKTQVREHTPLGWKTKTITQNEYELRARHMAREMVRETGYNIVRMVAEGHKQDEEWSRAVTLYNMACDHLRTVDCLAETFILHTYAPKF